MRKTGNTTHQVKKIKQSVYLEAIQNFLKNRFPDIPFTLKIKRYVGGKSLKVSWVGLPEKSALADLQELFNGASFDHSRFKTTLETFVGIPGETTKIQWGFDFIILDKK